MYENTPKKHHWVHVTCGIRITKIMKFHKTAINKLSMKTSDWPKQNFMAEIETLKKFIFVFLCITERLLINYKLKKHTWKYLCISNNWKNML